MAYWANAAVMQTGRIPGNAPAKIPLTTKRKSLVWSKAPLRALTVPLRRAMGPSAKSVASATTHAINAKTAERTSPFAMKNANGATRSRRIAVSALAISGQIQGDEADQALAA